MSHRSADDLSDAIDSWLSDAGPIRHGYLAKVVEALSDSLPPVADSRAKERVRRRLAGFNPSQKSAQQVLVERAVDEIQLIRRRLTGEEYVPWSAVVGAGLVVFGSIGLAVWLRRRGIGEAISSPT